VSPSNPGFWLGLIKDSLYLNLGITYQAIQDQAPEVADRIEEILPRNR